ncbi:MAG: STAS domain-containing protein [Deltaproteobacteria bacterium]|nr:STAS domain-containing protein [Deltaproteobacteria bacterium]
MASNFRIVSRRKGGNLRLNLTGDFDGTSAHELLNALAKNITTVCRIFIDTDGLKTIHPFGLEVFRNYLVAFEKRFGRLVFTGEKKIAFAPQGSKYL